MFPVFVNDYAELMTDAEVRKQLRRLIFVYHPDRALDDATRQRHEEITKHLTARYGTRGRNRIDGPRHEPRQIEHRDPAYKMYRLGYGLYERIHPASWRQNTAIDPFSGALSYLDPARQVEILRDTLEAFRLATECFRVVIRDHPASPWVHDSREKIELLRSLYDRYVAMAERIEAITPHEDPQL